MESKDASNFSKHVLSKGCMYIDLIEETKAYVTAYFKKNYSEHYTYHNLNHTYWVFNSVSQICEMTNVLEVERSLVLIAALFHDIAYHQGSEGHEYRSAEMAAHFLKQHHMIEEHIEIVGEIIIATKLENPCTTELECIICDADLSGLSGEFFFPISENLRKEIEYLSGAPISLLDWAIVNNNFLRRHSYQSEAGRVLFQQGKIDNLHSLKILISSMQ